MDRQHEHIFVGDSDHHGFLLDHTGKCIDPIFEKGIAPHWGLRNSDCGLENLKSKSETKLFWSCEFGDWNLCGCWCLEVGYYFIFQMVPEGASSKTIPLERRSFRISSALFQFFSFLAAFLSSIDLRISSSERFSLLSPSFFC